MTQQEFSERYEYDSNRNLLGEGGFGRVYRAYDGYEHEYVALKMQNVDPKHPELRLRNESDGIITPEVKLLTISVRAASTF